MAVPNPPTGPWTSSRSPQHSLYPMPLSMLEALEAGDLPRAASHTPASLLPLPYFLISTDNRGIWRRRLDQITADPEHLPWLSRLIVYEADKDPKVQGSHQETQEASPAVIVGRIGFHGKPDEDGIVEVGYEVDPAKRRRGHATAAMHIIADVARSTEGVNILRAHATEDNAISARIIEGEGLKKVGNEMHERRGLEDIYLLEFSK